MAMVVKNNMAAVRTLNTLNSNSGALQKSLAKVSSGMRINSAQDDASGYAISERMRVQIRALDQANQNTQNGSSLMKTAEGAVASTVEILKTLKEKAINAATDTNTDADRQTIQKEVNQFIDQIDDNALVTFNGKYLVEGSKTQSGKATYTAFTNQNLAVDTSGTTLLTNLTNRKGESLEIGTSDKITASFVKDGHTYATTFSVVDDNSDADGYKLQDIFVKLNDEYVEQTKGTTNTDEIPAFGAPNTEAAATSSGNLEEALDADAMTAINNQLSGLLDDSTNGAAVEEMLASIANGLTVGDGSYTYSTSTTLDNADKIKEMLAVAANYTSEGKKADTFEDSALYTAFETASTNMAGTVAGKLSPSGTDVEEVKLATVSSNAITAAASAETIGSSGEYETVADAAEALVGSMGDAAQAAINSATTLVGTDGSTKIEKVGDAVQAIADASKMIAASGGSEESIGLTAEDTKGFAQAYLLQAAGDKFRDSTEAKNLLKEVAKKADEWVEEISGGGGNTGGQAETAALEAAQAFVAADSNTTVIQAIASGDTSDVGDDTLVTAAKEALAFLATYDSEGKALATGGTSAADSSYDAAASNLANSIAETLGESASVTVAKLTSKNNDTWYKVETEDKEVDTENNTIAKIAEGIVDVMNTAIGYYLEGTPVGTGNTSTASIAESTVDAAEKVRDKTAGDADGADDFSGVDVSSFASAASVKAAIAKINSSELDSLAASFVERNSTTNLVMGSGLMDDTTNKGAATVDDGDLVYSGSEIGLAASGEMVKTADGSVGLTVTANESGLGGQISGLTISVANSEGQVKKTTNEFLNAFNTTIFAANDSLDYSLKLHVGSNANQSISVGLQDMRAEALGLKGSDGTVIDISTQERANAAIAAFDNALQKALDQQTTIGAVEARLEYTASNLTTSAENTQAAESAIRDADMAKEMTNYTKNNVLLQAAQSMLAQANQNASAVLSLLQ